MASLEGHLPSHFFLNINKSISSLFISFAIGASSLAIITFFTSESPDLSPRNSLPSCKSNSLIELVYSLLV